MKTLLAALTLCLGASAFASDAQDLWAAKCGGCHGADGSADTRQGRKEHIPDFTQRAFQAHATDAQLREVIREGSKDNPKMKAFKDRLTAEQIDSLVTLIRGFGPQGAKTPAQPEAKPAPAPAK